MVIGCWLDFYILKVEPFRMFCAFSAFMLLLALPPFFVDSTTQYTIHYNWNLCKQIESKLWSIWTYIWLRIYVPLCLAFWIRTLLCHFVSPLTEALHPRAWCPGWWQFPQSILPPALETLYGFATLQDFWSFFSWAYLGVSSQSIDECQVALLFPKLLG